MDASLEQEKPTHLTERQLAARWSMAAGTLNNWRSAGRGPDYVKIGRAALYRVEDVELYEKQNTVA
jgi:hypothetical protein